MSRINPEPIIVMSPMSPADPGSVQQNDSGSTSHTSESNPTTGTTTPERAQVSRANTANGVVSDYKFIKPDGLDPYRFGDAYYKGTEWREQWANLVPNPWAFIDISQGSLSHPWGISAVVDEERGERTNVCLLEYRKDLEPPKSTRYDSPSSLKEGLEGLKADDQMALRLFVVEDLSRAVIESLGHKFAVEPDFFREHLYAHAWNNLRDGWKDAPSLEVDLEQRRWLQIRFPRARYFESDKAYARKARTEEINFNVERRADDDENQGSKWDRPKTLTSLMRSKASLWTKRGLTRGEPLTAILLLDPTIKEGYPLWKGYKNWAKPPSSSAGAGSIPEGPKQTSFFDDFIHWAQRPECFPQLPPDICPSRIHLPVAILLHLIASEWLLIIDYVKARLNIIDWELAYPMNFVKDPNDIDGRMRKLHAWRRFIPVFREMLSDMLLRVFHTSSHIQTMRGGDFDTPGWLKSQPGKDDHIRELITDEVLQSYKRDFALALGAMEEFQKRIERLTQLAVQTSIVDDSRRSMADNRNLHRLTWLATLFLPLSFIAALMSMQAKVSELEDTMQLWALIALPSAVLTLGVVFLISSPWAKNYIADFLSLWARGVSWKRSANGKE
ncbi:hypothetical protein ACHAQH_009867 [Verticillium albo-atrum]